MDSLNSISSEGHAPPQQVEGLISRFPSDLMHSIRSYLIETRDRRALALTNHAWSRASHTREKHEQVVAIGGFAQFLMRHLNKEHYPIEIKRFNELRDLAKDKIFGLISLLELKPSISPLRKQMIEILKNVKEEDLKSLKALSQEREPLLEQEGDIFLFAQVDQKIESLKKMEMEEWERSKDIHLIVMKDLFQAGLGLKGTFAEVYGGVAHHPTWIDRGIEIIEQLPVGDTKFLVLSNILALKRDFDQALEFANKLSDAEKSRAFSDIARGLINRGQEGDRERAMKLIDEISDVTSRTLLKAEILFKKEGRKEEAAEQLIESLEDSGLYLIRLYVRNGN